jgi:hypothetical protein
MKTAVILLVLVYAPACGPGRFEREARAMTGGDPGRGRTALRTCHTIPGVATADATWARR